MILTYLKKLFSGSQSSLEPLFEANAIILDVRTSGEYKSGHVQGSKHIPLDQLSRELVKLRALKKPIITCCATGRRSGVAADMLHAAGMQAVNGGSWTTVRNALQQFKTRSN